MSIQEVIDLLNKVGVDYDGAYGQQCMDLVQIFNRLYKATPLIGNAKDVWNTYPVDFYERYLNTPEAVPQLGDLIIWDGEYGHIAIFVKGNVNKFTSFDQNFPTGSFSHLQEHDYTNVIGWIRPKNIPPDIQAELDKVRKERDTNWNLYSPFKDAGFPTIDDVIKAIEEKQALIEAVKGYKKALQDTLDIGDKDWQGIVNAVTETIKERDDTLDQAKVGDTLWDAIVAQTGLQVVKYTSEGIKTLVDALQTLKMAVPEGHRLMTEDEYNRLVAKRNLDRYTIKELFKEILNRLLG
jgi:hypothetical protein